MARCDLCGNAPRWIYRVGKDEICGACCANRLAEARAENAKLRARCDCVGRRALEQENANLRESYGNASESYGGLCRTLDDSGKRNTELENVIREMAIEVEQAGPSGMYSMWIKRWPFIERLLKEGGDDER